MVVNRRGESIQDKAQRSAWSLEDSGATSEMGPGGYEGPEDFQGKVFRRAQDPRSEAQGRG